MEPQLNIISLIGQVNGMDELKADLKMCDECIKDIEHDLSQAKAKRKGILIEMLKLRQTK